MGFGDFNSFIESLDPDSRIRGKQFEKTVKWWLQNDPIHCREYKKVWLWDEWPERSGPDIGIDLVALRHDNTLCAIQAKCFASDSSIPKSEIDSFISAASPRKFAHRMLVSTTDGLSANARKTLRDNHITLILRSYLESLTLFWPETFSSLGGPRTISKYTPRSHQQNAINDVLAGMQQTSRGQLIMACGTGKTLTALWITERLNSSCTLVLVPSLSLLSQTLSEWATHANSQWSYLCVCSDETVNKSDDLPISNVDELPFEVTTKPADIAKFLKTCGRKIVFSTYQSSAQVAKAQKIAGEKFDLTIADEAHRLTGKNDAEFATVLDSKKIPTKKLLFMTATPRTYTTAVKQMASDRGVEMSSMDDEKVFGKELHKLSFGQAIEQDLLTDYRVVIVGVTDPQVQELIERRELVSVAGVVETDARTLAAHIGLAKAVKDYDLKKTISFHGRIKTAQAFAQDFPKIVEWMPEDHKPSGTFWADTITGAMNSSDRRILLDKLKADVPNQHSLLSNARCLTEGIDVPALDAVAFIDPRSSQVDIIQAVGRAIRKSNNKTLGTIVLPVLIPHDVDAETAVEDSAFKPIWGIVNALRAHDEELAIQLDEMRTSLGRTKDKNLGMRKVICDLPADIDLLIPEFSSMLNLALLQHATQSWNWWFGLLQNYVEENGTSRIEAVDLHQDQRLGAWVVLQRSARRGGQGSHLLTPERQASLEALPDWTWDPAETRWKEMYELTRQESLMLGDSRLPNVYVNQTGQKLGLWVSVQRRPFNRKNLSTEQIDLLEQLPKWTFDPYEYDWEEAFSALKSFCIKTGSSRMPRGTKEAGRAIDAWCTNQRRDYKKGLLEQEKIEMIEALPDWSWDPLEDDWNFCYQALKEFVIQQGNYTIPKKLKLANGVLLSSWLSNQKDRKKNGKLRSDRIERLESLPNWTWEFFDTQWQRFFEDLVNYLNRHNQFPTKSFTGKSGKQLGSFILHQRSSYRDGSIRQESIELLESLPGWSWDPLQEQFDEAVSAIRRYVSLNGHANIPHSFLDENGLRIGAWVSQKRVRYKKNKLDASQINTLERIPTWQWSVSEDMWTNSYEALKQFALRESHCSVPKSHTENGISINTWGGQQRSNYRRKKLTISQMQLLELLPGWSWKPKGGPPKKK